MGALYFKQLQLGPMQNFIYLLGDPQTREAAVVDPGWDVAAILRAAKQEGYRISAAIATHHHFDHVNGLGELLDAVDIPVYAHRDDAHLIQISRPNLKSVADGETVSVGRLPVSLIHTPGHTPGSQCLVVHPSTAPGTGGLILTGDTLFIGSIGRSDLPGGDPRALYESLNKKIKPMDDATTVCPGHDYGQTPTAPLGEEKRSNPFLKASTLQDFLRLTGG